MMLTAPCIDDGTDIFETECRSPDPPAALLPKSAAATILQTIGEFRVIRDAGLSGSITGCRWRRFHWLSHRALHGSRADGRQGLALDPDGKIVTSVLAEIRGGQ